MISDEDDDEITLLKAKPGQTSRTKNTPLKSGAKITPLKTAGKSPELKSGGKSTPAKSTSAVKATTTPRITKKDIALPTTPSTQKSAVKRLSLDPQAARMMTPRSNKRLSLAPKRYLPDDNSEDDFETTKSLVKKATSQSAKKAKIENESPKNVNKAANSRPARRASSLMQKTILEEPLSQMSDKFIQKTEITSRPRRASTQIMSPCVVKRSASAKKVTPKKSLKTKIVKSESEEESEFSEAEEESSDDEIVVKAGRPSLAKKQVCKYILNTVGI